MNHLMLLHELIKEVNFKMKTPLLLSAILLMIISLFLYKGKGINSIAGYNTLSLEEKNKINETKLAKILAITLDITSIILILGALGQISTNDTILISIVLLIIGTLLSSYLSKK